MAGTGAPSTASRPVRGRRRARDCARQYDDSRGGVGQGRLPADRPPARRPARHARSPHRVERPADPAPGGARGAASTPSGSARTSAGPDPRASSTVPARAARSRPPRRPHTTPMRESRASAIRSSTQSPRHPGTAAAITGAPPHIPHARRSPVEDRSRRAAQETPGAGRAARRARRGRACG